MRAVPGPREVNRPPSGRAAWLEMYVQRPGATGVADRVHRKGSCVRKPAFGLVVAEIENRYGRLPPIEVTDDRGPGGRVVHTRTVESVDGHVDLVGVRPQDPEEEGLGSADRGRIAVGQEICVPGDAGRDGPADRQAGGHRPGG